MASRDRLTLFPTCTAHSIAFSRPLRPHGLASILKEDSATWLVLQLLQVLSMFPLLMTLVKKTCSKGLQNHITVVQARTGRRRRWTALASQGCKRLSGDNCSFRVIPSLVTTGKLARGKLFLFPPFLVSITV